MKAKTKAKRLEPKLIHSKSKGEKEESLKIKKKQVKPRRCGH